MSKLSDDEKRRRFLARIQSEVGDNDPTAYERFKAEHDGMTPIQWAIAQYPEAAEEVAKAFPHLAPPKK